MDKKIDEKVSAPVTPVTEVAHSSNTNFTHNPGYVRKSRGYPVQPGQTWHDLTAAQRKEWFFNHENRWKLKFVQEAGQAGGSMNWTRG